jgi:16S rRNA (cytosine967-C5)-methyltransferase
MSFSNNNPRPTSPQMSKRIPAEKPVNLRAKVIVLLEQVYNGQSLNQVLPKAIDQINPRDKALFNELVMGTLRHWFALDAQIQPMLSKQLNDARVHIALLLGLYQILQTRIPAHAAISETVEAIRQLKLDKASGLVNALLRRSTRELDSIQAGFEAHHGLPRWLHSQLKKDWPERIQHLSQTLRQPAPLTLRINSKQRSRDGYLQALELAGITAKACELAPQGIQLLQPVQVTELPGYAEGWFSVQDEHAQLCCELLGDLNQKIVLDACAAPGGKTAHILEKNTPSLLLAIDQDEKRLQRVHENLERLQLKDSNVQIIAADASQWQADQQFDVILLDAPCTATGVIRRHPDIRLLRQSTDVAQTTDLQAQLLDHLWQQLKPQGVLLYVTCSLLKAENEQQIAQFLSRTPNAESHSISITGAVAQQHGVQMLPKPNGGDGFYFAKLTKL